jgi:hypothetical protein
MNKMEETNLAVEGQVKYEKTFDMSSRQDWPASNVILRHCSFLQGTRYFFMTPHVIRASNFFLTHTPRDSRPTLKHLYLEVTKNCSDLPPVW